MTPYEFIRKLGDVISRTGLEPDSAHVDAALYDLWAKEFSRGEIPHCATCRCVSSLRIAGIPIVSDERVPPGEIRFEYRA